MQLHIKHSTTELANRISKALITSSNHQKSIPPLKWTPLLEQTLHGLAFRNSLSPQLVSRVIDPFLINHHSLALGFFNWAAQQPGFTHTSISYQSILKSLSVSRQFNTVDKLMKEIKMQKIVLSASAYRSVIASHLSGQKALSAFSVFSDVRWMICEIGVDICNALLAGLSSYGHLGNARQVFDEMLLRGVRVTTLGFGVFIWRFCGNSELGDVLMFIDDVKRQVSQRVNGSVVALLVVHGLCFAGRVDEAVSVLDVLRKKDCKPDFMAYRAVAEALRETGNVAEVEKVLKMKRKLGVSPRGSDYRDFIFQLISERLVCEARDIGEVIVSGNFPIEDDVLNALIGSVSAEDPSSALRFFKYLVEKDRLPTLLTFTNLSRNLCRHGKHAELVEVSKTLSGKAYFVDIERYNIMVSFFCKAGKVKEAYEVLQEMKKKGWGPDIVSYNSVMEACCRENMVRPAKRLWDEMFANGCEADLRTYNILISKFVEIGQVKEANGLFCHMLEKRVEPNATTYVFLLKGLCQENEVVTGLEVFKKSFEQDAEMARTLLGKFILYLCKKGHFIAASSLVRDYNSTIGNSESNMILLKCLADAGEVPLAIEHIKMIGKMSPPMMHELRTGFLSSLSSPSKPQPILEIIQVIETLQLNHAPSE
uniref:pentatricopeptide repeat-containing protein At5g14080 n=1 Tax=Erigeron canadensis TaxID=72917 RepID=UPI001CB9141F|nr:pentatricopeptide repeat-containing protein At5g14080 [Erigeron canadensis]